MLGGILLYYLFLSQDAKYVHQCSSSDLRPSSQPIHHHSLLMFVSDRKELQQKAC
jgi:hypothetical protein